MKIIGVSTEDEASIPQEHSNSKLCSSTSQVLDHSMSLPNAERMAD